MKAISKKVAKPTNSYLKPRLQEGLLILFSAFAIFLLVALVTYHHGDLAGAASGKAAQVANAGGRVGAWFSGGLFKIFGYMA